MEHFHTPASIDLDLSPYIARHSADKLIAYKHVAQEPLYLAYFLPPAFDANKRYPAFVFIHGGAWESRTTFGDQACWLGDHLGYLARYYAEKGFVCISVDYRLVKENGQVPGYGLIESYEDCCDAIDCILKTADTYAIDTERMFLLGESAGGHLAACVATFQYKKAFSFERVFLINPITDMNDPAWNSYVPTESDHDLLAPLNLLGRSVILSPLYQVDKHANATVLIHGDSDSCVDKNHSKAFYHRMQANCQSCDLHLLAETDHAFLLAEFTDNLNACKTGIQIINSYLFC